MSPLESRDTLRQALRLMSVQDASSASAFQIDRLRVFIEESIAAYYLSDGPDEYKQWRRSAGCVLRSRDEIDADGWLIEDARTFVEHSPEKGSLTVDLTGDVESCFDEIWLIARRVHSGMNVPRAIALGPDGCLSAFRRVRADQATFPFLEGGIGRHAWYGGTSMSQRRWFVSDRISELMRHDYLAATTGVVLEFGDGIRRPILFYCIWDESEGRWYLFGVVMTNRPSKHPTWAWEM